LHLSQKVPMVDATLKVIKRGYHCHHNSPSHFILVSPLAQGG
jgi:hypothetical protein